MHDAAPSFSSPLYSVEALRAIEASATRRLGDAGVLMQRAGQAGWRELLRLWPEARRIVVVCGPGNNGGDGYVLARHAREAGRDVVVVRLPEHAPRSGLAERTCEEYRAAGGELRTFEAALPDADIVVDAVFGIGLSRAPESASADLIAAANDADAPVLALDVPSGVDSDRGSVPGIAIAANHTLEFIAAKAGLCTGAALDRVGTRAIADLDLVAADFDAVEPCARQLAQSDLAHWLRPRDRDSHKGRNGRVLCIGGDHGHGGAIMLTAEAALRSGAGLVDVGTRDSHVPALLARLPEAMVHGLDAADPDALARQLDACDVVATGPGLGQGAWGRAHLAAVHAAGKPMVLDADALNMLAKSTLAKSPSPLAAGTVLTPHPGEAARLLECPASQVQADRCAAARELYDRYGCVVVLKGAGSVVTAPGELPWIIAAGNPGMAVGGMGDVLCGVIAALRAQGLSAFDAARCGALLHAVAGDRAAEAGGGERGLIPSDLMPWLRRLSNPGCPA
jgi:NAD(P)H-hydrate epimerase